MEGFSSKGAIKRAIKANTTTKKIISDLLNMDLPVFNTLNEKDMTGVIKKLLPEVRRRISAFDEDDTSPTVEKYLRSGGNFSVTTKGINELRKQYLRIKMFLDAKTSEEPEWEKTKKKIIDTMQRYGISMDEKNFRGVFKAYSLIREWDKSVAVREFKYKTLKRIIEKYEEGERNAKLIALDIYDELKDLYEKGASEYVDEDVEYFRQHYGE